MNRDIAIKVDRVNKYFKLPHEKQNSLKGLLLNSFRGRKTYERQIVLKDISFEIKKGEFFGIVGRNGSGKSTLLKLLAGIYSPNSGSIQINGKLTPFIELGVGFNPELTGRENVFLNGALLGFNRSEMTAMYDEIVEFAELEKFMDQKLKNYSSGMQVRLAFSIAIRANSEILVLDEVLAVGDEAFQKKCVDVFEKYKAIKKTIILVTHDMEAVRRFCSKALLIKEGNILEIGEPNKVAARYSRLNRESNVSSSDDLSKTSPIKLKITNHKNEITNSFETSETMNVKIEWPDKLNNVKHAGIAIVKNSGEFMFGANTLSEKLKINENKILYKVELSLSPGKYYLMAGLFGNNRYDVIDFLDKGPEIIIEKNSNDDLDGMVRLRHEWKA